MNKSWLIENAEAPIKYILTKDSTLISDLLDNKEVDRWFSLLKDRALTNNLADIHGSHDYRYENQIGKCFILGLNKDIEQFNQVMKFFINFLEDQIEKKHDDILTFGKMYQYRDYETILACYLPFLGYGDEDCVRYVIDKRIDTIYRFTKEHRYDIYNSNNNYPGAKKEWKPYIVDPNLYKDGNIAIPTIHDFILFAGIYHELNEEKQNRIDNIVEWILDDRYSDINYTHYYYVPDDPRYKSKGINRKVDIADFNNIANKEILHAIIFNCFIFSHFKKVQYCEWFKESLKYIEQYRTDTGRFIFPKDMIFEQKDKYVFRGGHMNVGQNKRSKNYAEIISTYWMERIKQNIYN